MEHKFTLILKSADPGAIKRASEKIRRWLLKFKTHLGLEEVILNEAEQ